MHARHPGGHPAVEPLVFDGTLHPKLATVSVANADTKPEDGPGPLTLAEMPEETAEPEESSAEPT